jgi:hypothetical protein
MEDKRWRGAAWMAISAAALMPANLFLNLLADGFVRRFQAGPLVVSLALVVGSTAAVLSLIALYRFRVLLNDRYAYHGIDALVTFVIIAIVSLSLLSIVGRIVMALLGPGERAVNVAIMFVAPIFLIGAATGIVGIILGVKLLSLENDLQHLVKSFAIVSIVSGACFALVILAPVGHLLLMAQNVILALLFFRADDSEPTVEFV